MDISVHLKPEAVAGLREGRALAGEATHELLQSAHKLGINLRPVFPVASTPEEAGQYVVQVDEPADAKHVLEKLNDCEAVETAYSIPSAEIP